MADFLDENIKTLMEVTGLDLEGAQRVFRFKDQILDHAINYILDGNEVPDDIQMNTTDLTTERGANKDPGGKDMPAVNIEDNEEVRAPIPAKEETMILPEDDNFRFRGNRRIAKHNICPLRNFEREGELLEEELYSNERISSRSNRRKRIRLEDIFRPPVDICFCGTFQVCRDYATEKNRWLIVNVQDHTEFLSQCMNRDVWSNINLKNIIRKYFIFWQISVENMEGTRFKTFYNVENCPYICIIDPRTGEHKIEIKNIQMKPDNFMSDFYVFLRENGPFPNSQDAQKLNEFYEIDFEDTRGNHISIDTNGITWSNASGPQASSSQQPSTSTSNNLSTSTKPPENDMLLEKLTEEEQIELAIKKSLSEPGCNQFTTINNVEDSDEDNEDIEGFSDDEITSGSNVAGRKNDYSVYLGSAIDPITKVQLRFPSVGTQETLEWPSTSKVRAIKLYIIAKYPELAKCQYKIINNSTFPKRNIMEIDENTPFDKCDLHPDCILYIHPDD